MSNRISKSDNSGQELSPKRRLYYIEANIAFSRDPEEKSGLIKNAIDLLRSSDFARTERISWAGQLIGQAPKGKAHDAIVGLWIDNHLEWAAEGAHGKKDCMAALSEALRQGPFQQAAARACFQIDHPGLAGVVDYIKSAVGMARNTVKVASALALQEKRADSGLPPALKP